MYKRHAKNKQKNHKKFDVTKIKTVKFGISVAKKKTPENLSL